ncbi:hypothetical protein BDQ94DRAFT_141912 [Aspergillus welwitschiae]|uniref:Uncharacterized protein n=1 Tax=Aspergillus welwitschiae TaxID=1341132 RepID=A0A3F3Q486_9EURO|nr:hypothetical protein BDQ94DRAFT_141912 [Aspergillus welwitschiae]RDH34024.1 hypothetical protein BDQ94DRAFT_141912 [Aspergillus welwitschiae]
MHGWMRSCIERAFTFLCNYFYPFTCICLSHRLLVPRAVQPGQLSPAASCCCVLWISTIATVID